jgi:hypothetical protein
MFPCKEELIYFEEMMRKQVRIWNDSCDVGYRIICPSVKAVARRQLMALMEFYKGKVTRMLHKPSDTSTEVFIPFEFEDDMAIGVMLVVNYMSFDRRNQREEWFSIEERRYNKKISECEFLKEETEVNAA